MIIWSGLGILVVVSLIISAVITGLSGPLFKSLLGASTANYFAALILLIGAAVNYGIGILLYRGGDKVLIDPKTRQPYRVSPNHSLFFIPFRAFTYIFLIIGIVMTIGGYLAPEVPEYTDAQKDRFDDVLTKVSNETRISGGNTAMAKAAAQQFQKIMVGADASTFENRNVKLRDSRSRGKYFTYCLIRENVILFAADIEEYDDYSDSEVKTLLHRMAWGAAFQVANSLDNLNTNKIIVVLREGRIKRDVLQGGRDLKFTKDSSIASRERLFHLFDESAIVFSGPAESQDKDDEVAKLAEMTESTSTLSDDAEDPVPEEKEAQTLKANPPAAEPIPVPEQTTLNPLSDSREWTDNQGRKMSAKFLSVDGDKVVFEKADGNSYRFPIENLSNEDQNLIEKSEK